MVKSEGTKYIGAGDVTAVQAGSVAKVVTPAPTAAPAPALQEPQAGGSYQRCPESGALTRVDNDAPPDAK